MADPPFDPREDHEITPELTIQRMTTIATAVLNQHSGTNDEEDRVINFLPYLFHPRLASDVERDIHLVITIDSPAGVPPGAEGFFRAYQITTLRDWLDRVACMSGARWVADQQDKATVILRGSEPGRPPGSYPDDWFEEALKWRADLGANVARTAKDDSITLGLYSIASRPATRLEYQKAHNDRSDHLALDALMQLLVARFGRGAVEPAALLREHLRGAKLELLKAVLAVLAIQPGVKDKFRKYEAGVAATERLGEKYPA